MLYNNTIKDKDINFTIILINIQMQNLHELQQYLLQSQYKNNILDAKIQFNELSVVVEAEVIKEFLLFLRDDNNCMFQVLVDLCGVDYPQRTKRFEIVYALLSISNNLRILVKISADTETLVPSITEVYSAAGWYEREAWDLYGIYFSGHDDLRRILTDYGFIGHPMRKDFPLTGYTEVRYDIEKKQVVYEKAKLTQEFRNFDFVSPWEGSDYLILPGDEKASK